MQYELLIKMLDLVEGERIDYAEKSTLLWPMTTLLATTLIAQAEQMRSLACWCGCVVSYRDAPDPIF